MMRVLIERLFSKATLILLVFVAAIVHSACSGFEKDKQISDLISYFEARGLSVESVDNTTHVAIEKVIQSEFSRKEKQDPISRLFIGRIKEDKVFIIDSVPVRILRFRNKRRAELLHEGYDEVMTVMKSHGQQTRTDYSISHNGKFVLLIHHVDVRKGYGCSELRNGDRRVEVIMGIFERYHD